MILCHDAPEYTEVYVDINDIGIELFLPILIWNGNYHPANRKVDFNHPAENIRVCISENFLKTLDAEMYFQFWSWRRCCNGSALPVKVLILAAIFLFSLQTLNTGTSIGLDMNLTKHLAILVLFGLQISITGVLLHFKHKEIDLLVGLYRMQSWVSAASPGFFVMHLLCWWQHSWLWEY